VESGYQKQLVLAVELLVGLQRWRDETKWIVQTSEDVALQVGFWPKWLVDATHQISYPIEALPID
jgi:hypothetical protein